MGSQERHALGKEVEKLEEQWQDVKEATQRMQGKTKQTQSHNKQI